MKVAAALVVAAGLTAACASAGSSKENRSGQAAAPTFRVVARGFLSPVFVGAPRSEPNRLYVVEQGGRIMVIVNGKRRSQPFLNIQNIVKSGGEQGLLSVAFHPNYAKNHRFYVDYTDLNGNTRVVEYRSNGKRAILSSRRQLLFVRQPYPNHNGGDVAFGPDGQLYVGMGDGGSGGDPENRSQNLGTLLGKLVRIDVNRRPAQVEVAAYGLRNPWRFSWDRATKDLYIADVGQGDWEEVDFLPAGTTGLINYGWPIYEGRVKFKDTPLNTRGRLVNPVYVYSHSDGDCSITGGYVYRGSAVPSVRGRYYFGDYCTGRIWSLRVSGGQATGVHREPGTVPSLSSFGENARGELYAVSQGGTIYRLRAR